MILVSCIWPFFLILWAILTFVYLSLGCLPYTILLKTLCPKRSFLYVRYCSLSAFIYIPLLLILCFISSTNSKFYTLISWIYAINLSYVIYSAGEKLVMYSKNYFYDTVTKAPPYPIGALSFTSPPFLKKLVASPLRVEELYLRFLTKFL